jgi:hypothetical protein
MRPICIQPRPAKGSHLAGRVLFALPAPPIWRADAMGSAWPRWHSASAYHSSSSSAASLSIFG